MLKVTCGKIRIKIRTNKIRIEFFLLESFPSEITGLCTLTRRGKGKNTQFIFCLPAGN